MPQFLIEKNLNVGVCLTLEGGDAKHISTVLRLKKGEWIVLADGRGGRYRAEITGLSQKSVNVKITEMLPDTHAGRITLAEAVIKHDRTEAIIQKAVELGVPLIIPFLSERTIPKYSAGLPNKKMERWNRIALEAAKQCGLAAKPHVEGIVPFCKLMELSSGYKHKLMFYEGEEKTTLEDYFTNKPTNQQTNTLIIIGPEGGFTEEEVKLARGHGFTTIRLGPLIMRVETAAISAIALTQYFLGHFS